MQNFNNFINNHQQSTMFNNNNNNNSDSNYSKNTNRITKSSDLNRQQSEEIINYSMNIKTKVESDDDLKIEYEERSTNNSNNNNDVASSNIQPGRNISRHHSLTNSGMPGGSNSSGNGGGGGGGGGYPGGHDDDEGDDEDDDDEFENDDDYDGCDDESSQQRSFIKKSVSCNFASSQANGSFNSFSNELSSNESRLSLQQQQQLLKNRSKGELICVVCGASANGYNFDAITCESCKAFFRRNAFRPLNLFRCSNNNSCVITISTRKKCKKCRIMKCFKLGMRRDWIMTEGEREEKKRKIEENRRKKATNTSGYSCSGGYTGPPSNGGNGFSNSSDADFNNSSSFGQYSDLNDNNQSFSGQFYSQMNADDSKGGSKPIRRRRRRRRHSVLELQAGGMESQVPSVAQAHTPDSASHGRLKMNMNSNNSHNRIKIMTSSPSPSMPLNNTGLLNNSSTPSSNTSSNNQSTSAVHNKSLFNLIPSAISTSTASSASPVPLNMHQSSSSNILLSRHSSPHSRLPTSPPRNGANLLNRSSSSSFAPAISSAGIMSGAGSPIICDPPNMNHHPYYMDPSSYHHMHNQNDPTSSHVAASQLLNVYESYKSQFLQQQKISNKDDYSNTHAENDDDYNARLFRRKRRNEFSCNNNNNNNNSSFNYDHQNVDINNSVNISNSSNLSSQYGSNESKNEICININHGDNPNNPNNPNTLSPASQSSPPLNINNGSSSSSSITSSSLRIKSQSFQRMSQLQQIQVNAINEAYKQAIRLVKAQGSPKNTEDINTTINLTELGVRRIIFYFKLISDFRNLDGELMVKLLKRSMMALLQVHGVNSYNKTDNTFKEPDTDDTPFSADSLQAVYGPEVYNMTMSITRNLYDICDENMTFIKVLMLIILFDPTNPALTPEETDIINRLQNKYTTLIYAYMCEFFGEGKADVSYKNLLTELNRVNEMARWFEKVVSEKSNYEYVRPLMKEIFSLPSDNTPPSSIAPSSVKSVSSAPSSVSMYSNQSSVNPAHPDDIQHHIKMEDCASSNH